MARRKSRKSRRGPRRDETPPKPDTPPRRPGPKPASGWRWGLLVVGIVAFAVYANTLTSDFVWDDRPLILRDAAVRSLSNLGNFFTQDFFARHESELQYGYYRPVVKSLYALEYAWWGRDPFGYHLTNVLLHVGSTLLVVLLLRRLGARPLPSLLAGLFFAVHPIHTESVAWIAGRTDVVAFFFSALSFLLFLAALPPRGAEDTEGAQDGRAPADRRWRSGVLIALSCFCFALALLAKEMSVVVAPWAVLALRFVHRRSWKSSLVAAVPFILLIGAYLFVRFVALEVPPPGQPPDHTSVRILLSAAPTLMRYLGWLLGIAELNAYVQNPYVLSLWDWRFPAATVALAALLIGIWWWGRKRGEVLALAGILAFSFVPIINIIRIAGPPDMGNMMAERFCYFPSFPVAGLVALGCAELLARPLGRLRFLVWAAFAGWVVYASAATVGRNREWRDELTFLNTTLSQSPTSALLWTNLANYHLTRRQMPEATEALNRAAALAPTDYTVLATRATWYVVSGRPTEAVPLQEMIAGDARQGRTAALNNLAYLYRITGRRNEAARILEPLVAEGRGYPDVYFNLAEIYGSRGHTDRARELYQRALAGNPEDLRTLVAIAKLEVREGRLTEAEAVYREALEIHPGDSRIYNNLANLRYRQGDHAGALELMARAVRLNAGSTTARINYAHMLAGLGRAAEAVAQLESAVRTASDPQLAERAQAELDRLRRQLDAGVSGHASGSRSLNR
ncbi:MAG: tetratricopeptide repeat protein [bacterium]|nr:tetratricopeptide repeat protein [bacterium]